jgi:hypothetical protein
VASLDKTLVNLVRHRVGDADRDGRDLTADRPEEQESEHGVLRHVGELPQDEVPPSEPGAEIRDRGEPEDQRGPQRDRQPAREGAPHASMIGSRAT